jgi:hypothetical protein
MIHKRNVSKEDTPLFLHSVDDEEIILLNTDNNPSHYDKYINKHKLLVYVVLKMANPLTKVVLVEYSAENVFNHNTRIVPTLNSIYVFYNINTNKVKCIKYRKKNKILFEKN